ncbi:hypothetical protein AHF37_12129 [Paragonimus kellicotti]|nr:hypothetical protein AHF37_12129 [Paragonimus kellicotti]
MTTSWGQSTNKSTDSYSTSEVTMVTVLVNSTTGNNTDRTVVTTRTTERRSAFSTS